MSAIGRTAARQLRGAGGSPAFGTLRTAGLAGVSSDFSSGFEGLHRSIQCEGIRALSAIGVDCGALFGKGRGKPGLWDATSGGPYRCFKWFSSDFEGLHRSIQCEGIRALSAIGWTVARHLRRAGGSPAFGTLRTAGLTGVSSGFQVISRDCISQSNVKEFGL